ncbi:MAG: radical SAM protein [Desulfobacterales bacterium]|nr:MAG: radical SAM protein [Desulfobacterales bacterium]
MKTNNPGEAVDPLSAIAPDHVQIQTVTGCNAACIFCPNGKTKRHIPIGRRMHWDLYRSIVDQCIALGVRRYSVYLMNEPLLDRELPERIAYLSARIKKPQYSKITSHGGLLSERMAMGLLDSGLDKLRISVLSLNPETYWNIMRLPLKKTLRNLDRLLELKKKGGYKKPRLEILMVDSIHTREEIPSIRRYWKDQGIKLFIQTVENRADQENIRDTAVSAYQLGSFSWCRRMIDQIYILYDGRMVQCCSDWEQRSIMGDLTKSSLADIWYGAHYTDHRRRFAEGDVKGMICECCRKQLRKK